jgi:hypothetical protein
LSAAGIVHVHGGATLAVRSHLTSIPTVGKRGSGSLVLVTAITAKQFTQPVPAADQVLIPAEPTTILIPAEARSIALQSEATTVLIPGEPSSVLIPYEQRSFAV